MALNEIASNTDMMDKDINALTDELGKAKKQLEKMVTDITDLNTMWEGPSHMEFERQFMFDKSLCEDLFETIQSIIDNMTFAMKEYNRCNDEIGNIIGSI